LNLLVNVPGWRPWAGRIRRQLFQRRPVNGFVNGQRCPDDARNVLRERSEFVVQAAHDVVAKAVSDGLPPEPASLQATDAWWSASLRRLHPQAVDRASRERGRSGIFKEASGLAA
jgi:hypothetical protein